MNYYYLVFLVVLTISGTVFYQTVNNIAGFFVTALGGIAILLYLYVNYFKEDSTNLVTMWPSETYLRESGAQCPNYWKASSENIGKDKVKCIYVGPTITMSGGCADGGDAGDADNPLTKTFNRVEVKYPLQMGYEREDWMEKCTYNENIKPPWVEYELN
jgi:hypothetical protein